MTDKEILQRARELIATPETWTQGGLARDATGEYCDHMSDDAVSFCAKGAVFRAAKGTQDWRDLWGRLNFRAREKYDRNSIVDVNDDIGHDAVISLFDEELSNL